LCRVSWLWKESGIPNDSARATAVFGLYQPFLWMTDYKKRSLFRHIQNHGGPALLAHEEMAIFLDMVQKMQLKENAE